jgi:hypothetical protein
MRIIPKSHVGGKLADNVRQLLGKSNWAKDLTTTQVDYTKTVFQNSNSHQNNTKVVQDGGIEQSATFQGQQHGTSIDIDPDDILYKQNSARKGFSK